jgi:hypothetical protein
LPPTGKTYRCAAFVGPGVFGCFDGLALGEEDGGGAEGDDDPDGDAVALSDSALDGVSHVPANWGDAVPHPAAARATVASATARDVRSRR